MTPVDRIGSTCADQRANGAPEPGMATICCGVCRSAHPATQPLGATSLASSHQHSASATNDPDSFSPLTGLVRRQLF